MGHLYQRGRKKTWYLKYYCDGKQILKSMKTQNFRVARDKAKLMEAGIEPTNQSTATPPLNRIPLSTALEEFCTYLKSIRTETSYKNERTRLRRIFGDICPTLDFSRKKFKKAESYIDAKFLDEITSLKVNKFLQYRRNKEGVSSTTLSRDREILHKLFTWAEEHFGYNDNPIKAIKRPAINAPVIRFMDKSDITKQLKTLEKNPLLKTMVAVYIYAGLRREERLDKSVAETEKRIKDLNLQAQEYTQNNNFQKLTECLKQAENLQKHNTHLIKLIEQTEEKLITIAKTIAKEAKK